MATKKISDLQLRSSFDATCSLPLDDASQTWRATGQQVKDFILADGNINTNMIADGSISLAKLAAALQSAFVPSGSVLAYAGTAAPTGFLMCDGTQVSRTTYATLFSKIGTAHGTGDGSTTFHLPDYRGRFLRGVDGTAGNDPDKASRTAMNTGGNTANNVGSVQADQIISHNHSVPANVGSSVTGCGAADNTYDPGLVSGNTGGNETRPKNAYVNYIIKT